MFIFCVKQLHGVPESEVFCKPAASSCLLQQTCNSVLKFCTNTTNLYDFLCVQNGTHFFVVSVNRDAALAAVLYDCKRRGWIYEQDTGFTFEGFPSTEKALGRTYLGLLRVIAMGRPTAERLKDAKCIENFILS